MDGDDGGIMAHDGASIVHDPNTGRRYRLCYAGFGGTHPNGRRKMTLVYEECTHLEEKRLMCSKQYDQWDAPAVYCRVLRPCPDHRDPNERICAECGCETEQQTCIYAGCPTNADTE